MQVCMVGRSDPLWEGRGRHGQLTHYPICLTTSFTQVPPKEKPRIIIHRRGGASGVPCQAGEQQQGSACAAAEPSRVRLRAAV
jgi:hypothetical protein